MSTQVERDFYFDGSYEDKGRFFSYRYQIDGIAQLKPREVLEVGIGNKFVSDYLNQRGIDVTTLDFDEALGPDIVADVTSIPLPRDSFDVVACFEVLEHLPYERFNVALSELRRVAREHVLISLPDRSWYVRYLFHIADLGSASGLLSYPRLTRRSHEFDGQKRIAADIERTGLRMIKTYRAFERPFHRFFLLEK